MRNYLGRSFLALTCLTLVSVPLPVLAQGSPDLGMSIYVNPSTTSPGGTVGVFATVTNNTANKVRATVTINSVSPCGTETSLGYNRLDLLPGQTIQVTVSYPIPTNACLGAYEVSISSKSSGGGKNSSAAATTSASASLMVQ